MFEYCPGGSLKGRLRRRADKERGLGAATGRALFAQLCGALAHLHEKDIVHRDIKMENVLFADEGTAKLVDFGFSVSVEGNDRALSDVCGTYMYIAPEIFDPAKRGYGRPVDVWALGVLLFCVLAGDFPFQVSAATRVEAYRSLVKAKPPQYVDKLAPGSLDLLRALCDTSADDRVTAKAALSHAWMQAKSQAAGSTSPREAVARPIPRSGLV